MISMGRSSRGGKDSSPRRQATPPRIRKPIRKRSQITVTGETSPTAILMAAYEPAQKLIVRSSLRRVGRDGCFRDCIWIG
jgi:hypothetical protein